MPTSILARLVVRCRRLPASAWRPPARVHRPSRCRSSAVRAALALALALGALLPLAHRRSPGAATELFFSEYIEGSSNNKALEIYNGTGAAVDLRPVATTSRCSSMAAHRQGSRSTSATALSGPVADGDVFVVAQSAANADDPGAGRPDERRLAGSTATTPSSFARARRSSTSSARSGCRIPGTEWGTGLTSTADNTLRRKPTVLAGDTIGSDAFDPAVQWDGFAERHLRWPRCTYDHRMRRPIRRRPARLTRAASFRAPRRP